MLLNITLYASGIYDNIRTGTTVLQGGLASILHRMRVVLMDKKPFDFKDLMAFGMFILALLTFVFSNLK